MKIFFIWKEFCIDYFFFKNKQYEKCKQCYGIWYKYTYYWNFLQKSQIMR